MSKRSGLLFFMTAAVLLVLSVAAVRAQSLSESEKVEISNQAGEYFSRAVEISASDRAAAEELYRKALRRYNRLVEEGNIHNGKLYYNIGNINFLLGDIGRAILNYRRAEQYVPGDPNLVKNLAYAREMRQDKIEIKEKEKVLRTLFFFHYDLGPKTKLILWAIAYVFFWLSAGVKIFSRRPYTSWVFTISLFFVLLFGGSLYIGQSQASSNLEGVILDPEIIARQGDGDSYQPSFDAPLHAGTEFLLLENRGEWWQIELPDGRSCWIPSRSGELL